MATNVSTLNTNQAKSQVANQINQKSIRSRVNNATKVPGLPPTANKAIKLWRNITIAVVIAPWVAGFFAALILVVFIASLIL